jgi:hypothetical protein
VRGGGGMPCSRTLDNSWDSGRIQTMSFRIPSASSSVLKVGGRGAIATQGQVSLGKMKMSKFFPVICLATIISLSLPAVAVSMDGP